jgi:hypothetical protein
MISTLESKCDKLLLNVAFSFNWRRYTMVEAAAARWVEIHALILLAAFAASFVFLAGPHTRSLQSST